MERLTTIDLIYELSQIEPNGVQVSIGVGLLRSTKALYKSENLFFVFDMTEDFIFDPRFGYTMAEFKEEFRNYLWTIEQTIS